MTKPIGMLILTVKASETARFMQYARMAGRQKDVLIFNAESGLSFDFLHYFWNAGERAAGQIETVVEVFTDLMSIGKVYAQSSGDKFFENSVQQLMRATISTLFERRRADLHHLHACVHFSASQEG